MACSSVSGDFNRANSNKYYSTVSLTLGNCILPPEKLFPSPSEIDGLERETEIDLRILGCELIQTCGMLLLLPQTVMATGQVLFQRFYYSKSFVGHSVEIVAMACITLASKVEEVPRKIGDVINVFRHIKQVKSGKTIRPLILHQTYNYFKDEVIKAERRLLKELGFCVHVQHPHKMFVILVEILKITNQKLIQTAWNYMNDSLRTDIYVRYHPDTIACACIFLSARLLMVPLPSKPAWFLVFGVSEVDLHDISFIILSLYTRKKPNPENLEKIVRELRETLRKDEFNVTRLAVKNSAENNSATSQNSSPRYTTIYNEELNGQKRKCSSFLGVDNGRSAGRKRLKTSSSGSAISHSPSPKNKSKTTSRYIKDSHLQSRSKSRSSKENRYGPSYKKKHSRSRSDRSRNHHCSRKAKRNNYSDRSRRTRYRSRSHERIHHSSLQHRVMYKTHRDETKDAHRSGVKKRR